MAADANWPRWIHSSVAKILKTTGAGMTIPVPVLVEGIDDRSETFMSASDRVEVRVNGPFISELSAGYYRLYVDVNVVVNSMMGETTKNAYRLDDILGAYLNAMDGPLAIYRFGTGPDDDSTHLGCLNPRPGKQESIRVLHFGQISTTDRLKQGMVDARYVMYLNE